MKSALRSLAGALGLASTALSLHAQTDLGERFAQISVVTYEPIFVSESGTGLAGKFNLPVTTTVDLYLRGARATGDEGSLEWTDSRVAGGITFHWQAGEFRPFLTLEAGYEVFDYRLSSGESAYEYSEESAIYNGALGVEFALGDAFTVAPMATYQIFYDEPGGDWYLGLEANARLGERFGIVAAVLASSSSDTAMSLSARLRF